MKREAMGFVVEHMEELRSELLDQISNLERRVDGLIRTLELLESRINSLR